MACTGNCWYIQTDYPIQKYHSAVFCLRKQFSEYLLGLFAQGSVWVCLQPMREDDVTTLMSSLIGWAHSQSGLCLLWHDLWLISRCLRKLFATQKRTATMLLVQSLTLCRSDKDIANTSIQGTAMWIYNPKIFDKFRLMSKTDISDVVYKLHLILIPTISW